MAEAKHPYIAVASDMDGTLLKPDHTAAKLTETVLHYMTKELNIPFVFATGRHHVDVLATKRKLGLEGYVITSNGTRVHDNQGNVIIKNDLPPATAKRLALLANEDAEVATSIYQEDLWLINHEAKDVTEFYQDNKDVFFYRLFNPTTHDSYDNVYKVYYTSDNAGKLKELERTLAANFAPDEIYVAYSVYFCLEVTVGKVNKGVALGQLLEEQLFPASSPPTSEQAQLARRDKLLQQCIVFGDGQNDFEMLSVSGKACIMGNAQAVLRDRITAFIAEHPGSQSKFEEVQPNTEDGVARKLVEVFNIPKSVISPCL